MESSTIAPMSIPPLATLQPVWNIATNMNQSSPSDRSRHVRRHVFVASELHPTPFTSLYLCRPETPTRCNAGKATPPLDVQSTVEVTTRKMIYGNTQVLFTVTVNNFK
jgi:hypothetical protein